MPPIPHHHRSANGLHMFLGANPRPHDPLHPRLAARLDPSRADLTQPRSIAAYRSAIKNQEAIGACTGFSTAEVAEAAARIGSSTPPMLSAGWVYEEERRKEGGWPSDSGAFTDDGIDIAIAKGIPADSLLPYTGQAATEYDSGAAEADAPKHKYLASRLTIDVRDPSALKLIWVALDAQMPCYLETYWPENWFTPNAAGSVSTDYSSIAGGHSISLWGILPDSGAPGGGYLCLQNHWSPQWNTQAARYGHDLRAGDFLVPWAVLAGNNTPIMHIAATTPVQSQPQPAPTPTPAVKTLADYTAPIKGVIQSGDYDLNAPDLVAYQIAWWKWAEGATVMKPDYQLPSRPHLAGGA